MKPSITNYFVPALYICDHLRKRKVILIPAAR